MNDAASSSVYRVEDLEKFRAFFDGIPGAFAFLRGPNFIFEFANAAYFKLVGRDDIIGKPMAEALPEIANQPFPEILRRVYASGESYKDNEALVYLRSDGNSALKSVWVDLTYTRIIDHEGRPYGVVVFAIDVAEKVSARSNVQMEKAKLEAVFANASAALAIMSGSPMSYEKANSSYLSLFTNRPLVGRPMLEALPELRGQKFPALIDQVFSTGEAYVENEARAFLRKTEAGVLEERFFDQSYTRIDDQMGKPYGVLIHAVEVTERVVARRRTEEALAVRDAFLSIASHELRTPITGMRLQAQMMKRAIDKGDLSAFSPERVLKLVRQSNEGLDRMNRLVDDMLDISRIQSGRLYLHHESTEMVGFIRSILDKFSEQVEQANIFVSIDAPTTEVIVEIDRFRIEQVVTNLITNVVKYAAGAPLSVSIRKVDEGVRLLFVDHGPGIANEHHERIFERFERLVSANEISGMGLGLYIARQIVEAHKGRIYADSGAARGTTFVVELPIETISEADRA